MFLVFPNPQSIAQYLSSLLIEKIQAKPESVLGLATGSTMEPVYANFANRVKTLGTDLSRVTTFNLDEYVGLGATHPQSYNYYMHQHLFDSVGFDEQRLHLPDGLCSDLTEQCEAYSQLIKRMGGLDLQLLGVGTNGHIGFNEPGTPFDSRTHVVALSERTRIDNSRFFADKSQMPTQAITMGIQDIMEARELILVATGEHKAQVIADYWRSPVSESMPASVLKQHPKALIIVDEAAASLLPAEVCQPALALAG
ncbi:MAG TPA: glucosamine-6-phosphate deaminase [Paenalcaligenes sp.]|nr:glucosamine-6-phosphate deaminase [Paenalcaligenes sp.]